MNGRSTLPLPLLVVAGVALAACGGDASTPDALPDPPAASAAPGGEDDGDPVADGWIGGEPEWSGDGGDTLVADMAASDTMGARADSELEESAAETAGESGPVDDVAMDSLDAAVEPDVATASPDVMVDASPLRAGSVDDNADYEAYLAYLARIADLGVALRPFDPAGRVVVTVRGADGLPIAGAAVVVSTGESGDAIATITTTADGTARFLPAIYGAAADGTFTFSAAVGDVGAVAVDVAGGSTADLVVDVPGGASTVALDVLFLLDATGSMGDEIDRLKTSIDSIAARVAALEGAPDTRFGMTLYRDEGDAFVTANYDFTADVGAFRSALADVVADGGGDYAEALDEGLADALAEPTWRDPAEVLQLIVLVADAPPQVNRQVETPYTESIRTAVARGIKIFPVASSESDDQAEAVFRQLAQATGARFVFLTYGAGGAATGGSTDIERTDYEELALDDLVVRLIAEEVAALTGDGDIVPPPTPTTTTVPDGQ